MPHNLQDDPIVTYMRQRKWSVDEKLERKRYLSGLARNSQRDHQLAGKIGGMLIYNQVIEEYLTDIVDKSIFYIKAEIWPEAVELDMELDKATFGRMIDYFRQFATMEPNRDRILALLKKHNIKRNAVVHDLFGIRDLQQLSRELDDYARMADELLLLLDEYDDQVRQNFARLEQRILAQQGG